MQAVHHGAGHGHRRLLLVPGQVRGPGAGGGAFAPVRLPLELAHRVQSVRAVGSDVAFVTRGDANTSTEHWRVPAGGSIGKVVYRIPKVGYALSYIDSGPARLALVVLACRADRYSGTVTRSLPTLAADMGVHESTALRAVATLRKRGYLQVTHKQGISSTYRLVTPGATPVVTLGATPGVPPANGARTPGVAPPIKRKTGGMQEGARPLADTAAGAGGGENPGATWQPTPRPHPPGCQCGGTGWVDDDDGRVCKCEG